MLGDLELPAIRALLSACDSRGPCPRALTYRRSGVCDGESRLIRKLGVIAGHGAVCHCVVVGAVVVCGVEAGCGGV